MKKRAALAAASLLVSLLPLPARAAYYEKVHHAEYEFHHPAGAGRKVPLVIAITPNGDAEAAWRVWRKQAVRRGWAVFASSAYTRETEPLAGTRRIAAHVRALAKEHPIDLERVVVWGMSAGAMAAHFMSYYEPELVSGVVVNTGKIFDGFVGRTSYPRSKFAVLLASPTDNRHREMGRDRDFLESMGWDVLYLEFRGGHVLAPEGLYDRAAAWCARRFRDRKPGRGVTTRRDSISRSPS